MVEMESTTYDDIVKDINNIVIFTTKFTTKKSSYLEGRNESLLCSLQICLC